MQNPAFRRILAAVVVLACMSAAYGQAGPTQTGRALDANFQVGSGGFNEVVGGVGGVNSQLYVTGQIRGLGSFGGKLPYTAENQLRLSVPSSDLGNFLKQSVGLADVYANDLYTPTPYYDRSSTVLSVRAIEHGITQSDLEIPVTRANISRKLYSSLTPDYREVAWGGGKQQDLPAGGGFAPMYSTDSDNNTDPFVSRETMHSGDSLFGVNRFGEQQRLARELYELENEKNAENTVNAEVNREVDATLKPTEIPERKNPKPDENTVPSGDETETEAPPPNQDVYTDLLFRLQEQIRQRKEKLDNPELEPIPDEEDDGTGEAAPENMDELIQFNKSSGLFINRLAGKSGNYVNRKLSDCEKLLKEGKYYKAVEGYRLLTGIDSKNPLVYVGLAQSHLAAGELLNAAINFRSAMRILPPIMETRINLTGMLGEDVVKERLATVMDRIKGNANPSPMLAFLATYLNANIGDNEQAAKMAAVLKKVAGDDKLLDAYATFVISGKRPGETDDSEKPTTQPTTQPEEEK